MDKSDTQYEPKTELSLVPVSSDKSVKQSGSAYDGEFHIKRSAKFDGRPVSKRSSQQAFTC